MKKALTGREQAKSGKKTEIFKMNMQKIRPKRKPSETHTRKAIKSREQQVTELAITVIIMMVLEKVVNVRKIFK